MENSCRTTTFKEGGQDAHSSLHTDSRGPSAPSPLASDTSHEQFHTSASDHEVHLLVSPPTSPRIRETDSPARTRRLSRFGSVELQPRLNTYRVLVLTKKGSKQLFIHSSHKRPDQLKAIQVACGAQGYLPQIQDIKFRRVTVDIQEDLLRLEKSFYSSNYKFGVLYCKKGQNENEMFANQPSEENRGWKQFLELLGDRITLKGWHNFAGGLDVKNDSTGLHSVYTRFRDLNIMFHVSTYLPYFPQDVQQVERKRHLGNDIVVIVYLEDGQFDPSALTTQFNHVYGVVSVDSAKKDVRVEFAAKAGVRPFGPKLKCSTPFALDSSFREIFLAKLINAERAALQSPAFASKIEKTRKAVLEELVEKILQ
jgi:hypothetical protein